MLRSLLLPCACAALLPACAAGPPDAEPRPPAAQGGPESAWDYLRAKYDADGDGVLTALEYDRPGAELATLDLDASGVLTADDFDMRGLLIRHQRATRAQYMMLEYFQDDDQPAQLTDDEWRRAARAYDTDGDRVVERSEFRSKHRERRRNLLAPTWHDNPPGAEVQAPWPELLLGVDADGDGALAFGELEAFFHANDNGRGYWSAERYFELPLPPGFVSLSGPRVGTPAPDFTLETVDGGDTITLSDHFGERPVALIFGSFT